MSEDVTQYVVLFCNYFEFILIVRYFSLDLTLIHNMVVNEMRY